MDSAEELARITPTAFRRGMAVVLLIGLGGLLIYLAANSVEAGAGLRLFFGVAGLACLAGADAVRRATTVSLILTEEGLHDSDGRVLFLTEDIRRIERSPFSFKPSNGFAVQLATRAPAAWAPGLWWRLGRRLGVGGVVSKAEAKFMGDMLALRKKLAEDGTLLTDGKLDR